MPTSLRRPVSRSLGCEEAMRWGAAGLAALLLLAGCSGETGPASPPDAILIEPQAEPVPQRIATNELPQPVLDTRAALLDIAEADSLRRLARFADSQPGFLSSLSDTRGHFDHWDLMRRTGFDPNIHLPALFAEDPGIYRTEDETWYVWPAIAARSARELHPDRLGAGDLAELRRRVGEDGLERIRGGAAYPGVRTAISETGRWLYFLHEPADPPRLGDTP